ncbi:AAA family ATPase [Larkinella humicola]|uniref:ATP-binding protein n=1 Tax=Larkinella humicola TaxID=2607654 RepID=A0A5N1JAQ8_9BACT|nr:AAA family ATPase [Larkinella humicola]KAA9349571.1 ATP-binding protein [Larkinella humicola]
MKRITEIKFINYKAFYQNSDANIIKIPAGKSVLIYGENGSGKSSIYEGLKQFFNSSDNTIQVTPSRHVAVPRTRAQRENEGTPEEIEREVLNEVAVKVTFTDDTGSEEKTFGTPNNNILGTIYIAQANLLNSFLSYRELLRTYLMDNLRDRTEFRRRFANLLIENILAKQKNSATQRAYISSWEALFAPRVWYKELNLRTFAKGLKLDIHRINLILNEILKYFEPNLNVNLVLVSTDIDYIYSAKRNRIGKYPICEVDLVVNLFGLETENDEENHLTVLNEARLSALAISIYLTALINTPQDNFDFKILFLDDIFIGLDMSNRLPLLEILKNFKKPIIEQFVDVDNDNIIIERILYIDGIIQTEPEPFFKTYQIFISTYDRFWFQVAKNWFETKSKDKWCYLELFTNQKPALPFNTPILYNSLDYLQKAEYHYQKHDYPSCANYLRKELEKRIKELLPENEHYREYIDNETGIKEIKKLRTLSQFLEKFISYCENNGINASELSDLKNLKDWYLNPFSHDNIGTPIFKRELDLAKILVHQIGKFQFKILLEAGSRLFFNFDNQAGQTRNYKIELQENLRWIESKDGNLLTNPIIQCYEWTMNAVVEVDPIWRNAKLFQFYNSKWKALLRQPQIDNVPMETFWNELYELTSGRSLITMI